MNQPDEYEDVVLPVYVINLENRTDRLLHIQDQFKDRFEFEINIVKACENENGALGLWQTIVKVAKIAQQKDEDVIIICEDDHKFTGNYSKKILIDSIMKANEHGVNVLIGGVGGFKNVVPITNNLCWVDNFWSTQFLVIYKQFFDSILAEPFTNVTDTADRKFSEMTSNKMVIFPFISIQKDFGYSDISEVARNHMGFSTEELFKHADLKLKKIYAAWDFYMRFENSVSKYRSE